MSFLEVGIEELQSEGRWGKEAEILWPGRGFLLELELPWLRIGISWEL